MAIDSSSFVILPEASLVSFVNFWKAGEGGKCSLVMVEMPHFKWYVKGKKSLGYLWKQWKSSANYRSTSSLGELLAGN